MVGGITWVDSRFSFVPFRIGLWPGFWDGGLFGAQMQCTHENGLNFMGSKTSDGCLIALAGEGRRVLHDEM